MREMATTLGRGIRCRVAMGSRWMSQATAPLVSNSATPDANVASADASYVDTTHVDRAELVHHVHVKLSHLLPSTKTPPQEARMGDLKTGRIRPTPLYVPLSKHVFGSTPRRDLLHAAVVYYLDGQRAGTASTKTRGEVAFSGAKIRPQKGSGQARLGTRSNPLLRKGGVIHGPRPRDMSSKLNRRVREFALRSALAAKWQSGDLQVVKSLDWHPPPRSTNSLRSLLKSKQWEDSLVLTAPRHPCTSTSTQLNPKPSAVDPEYTEEQRQEHEKFVGSFFIAMKNIPTVEAISLDKLTEKAHSEAKKPSDRRKPGELHAYQVLKRKTLICDVGAIEWLEEKLGGAIFHEEDLLQMTHDLKQMEEAGQKAAEELEDEREMVEEDILDEAERVMETVGADKPIRP